MSTDRSLQAGAPLARFGLFAGPITAIALYALLDSSGLSDAGRGTAAVGVWMATWWMTEALPIPATALIPLFAFPWLGIAPMKDAASPYGDPVIFLFLGGFLLGIGMQRQGLHRRIALRMIRAIGTSPSRLVAGFMAASGFISMWVSNTATVVMMLPIGLSLVDLIRREVGEDDEDARRLGMAILLGIAYASSIGGIATLIGTPPNGLLEAFVRKTYGEQVSFVAWARIGVPFALVYLAVSWFILARCTFRSRFETIRGVEGVVDREIAALGPLRTGEKIVLAVWVVTAGLWISRPLIVTATGWHLDDASIAIASALSLFILPSRSGEPGARILDWPATRDVPWGVLLLFGGGLSLASAIQSNGLAEHIGRSIEGLVAMGAFVPFLAVATIVVFLTELTSNTATTAALLPVLGVVSQSLEIHPYLLLFPATFAASCAFMLPVGTPANALVFGTGRVGLRDMVRAGLWLNVSGIALIVVCFWWLGSFLTGVDLSAFPDWARGRGG
jgi:sodium-dependent dicarboxylate transporter 2/3/5